MRGYLLNDWSKFDHENPEHQKHLLQALRYRCALPDRFIAREFQKSPKFKEAHKELRAAYQAFTTTGDFPATAISAIEKYHALTNYDNGYEQIFDVRDFTTTKEPGFKIVDVESGLTFERIPIGGKIKLKQMSGSQYFVLFDFYGGGLNWHRSLFMNQEYWVIEDNAMEFTNKAFTRRATVHYQLLEAAMDELTCITLQDPGCDDCNAYSIALAEALNTAAVNILNAVQNKGYGVTTGTVFMVLCPIQLMGALKRALSVTLQHYPASEKWSNFNFQPIYTMMLANTNRIGVFLPKKKIKSGYRMNLQTFSSFDMLTFSDATAGWMSYGAAVGDLDQVECIDATVPSGVEGGPAS